MDWGMMQDPYKVAQTVVGCKPANSHYYMPTAGMDKEGIVLENGNGQDGNANGFLPGEESNAASASHPKQPSTPSHAHNAFHHVCLRPRLRFGLVLSALIVVADSILRFSWLLRFVARFPSNDAFVLCTQFLEVFRRAIWNLLRVEWENIKIQQMSKGGNMIRNGSGDADEVKPLIMSHRRSKSRDSWGDGGGNANTRMMDVHPTLRMTGATGVGGSLEMKSIL